MSQRSKNNSIIFLTTLSVYLGLVLVGGAMPSVLAQAATTRNFNVQDEIEVKDDLDKNPEDGEKAYLTDSFQDYYLIALNELIQSLRELQTKQNFDLNSDLFDTERFFSQQRYFDSEIIVSIKDSGQINNKFLLSAVREAKDKFEYFSNFSDCFSAKGFDKNGARSSQAKLKLDKSEFEIKVSLEKGSTEKAKTFLEKLSSAKNDCLDKSDSLSIGRINPLEVISENTKIISENNQVFIVTRLPRGSLDALLKQDAKAESK